MSMGPQIFIGSSKEAYDKQIPQFLQVQLSEWAHARTWKQIFSMSETSIESLEKQFPLFDAFVFILTPDDILNMRNQTYFSARDNLLFEIGLAMGCKGRKNTFIIKQRNDSGGGIKLPSDLLGVGYDEFYYSPDSMNADFESLSNKIRIQYDRNHSDKETESGSDDILEPISYIKATLKNIETLKKDIEVLTGAEKTGVVNIYPSRKKEKQGKSLNESIVREFENARNAVCIQGNAQQETVCIQGITLSEYFFDRGSMYDHFMALIKSNCLCKVLIISPRSQALVDRVYWEAGPEGREDCKDVKSFMESTLYWDAVGSVQRAIKFMSQHKNLEVRCYSQAPTCFLVLTNRFAFTESYTYTTRGNNCPGLQIINGENEMYDLYKMHFFNLWESAMPVNQYNPDDPIDPDWFKMYESENKYDSRAV